MSENILSKLLTKLIDFTGVTITLVILSFGIYLGIKDDVEKIIIEIPKLYSSISGLTEEANRLMKTIEVLESEVTEVKLKDRLSSLEATLEVNSTRLHHIDNNTDETIKKLNQLFEYKALFKHKFERIYNASQEINERTTSNYDELVRLKETTEHIAYAISQRIGSMAIARLIVDGESLVRDGSEHDKHQWMTRANYFVKNMNLPKDGIYEKTFSSHTKSRISRIYRQFKKMSDNEKIEAMQEVSMILHGLDGASVF